MSTDHSSIRYRKRHILAGLCGYCPAKLDNKTYLCSSCRAKAVERTRNLKDKRKQNGLCLFCDNVLAPNSKTKCISHIEKRQRRTTMLLPAGLKSLTGKRIVEKAEFISIVESIKIESVEFIKTLSWREKVIFQNRFLSTEIILLKDIGKELNISRRWTNIIEQRLVGVYRDYLENRNSSSIKSNSSGLNFPVNQELQGQL